MRLSKAPRTNTMGQISIFNILANHRDEPTTNALSIQSVQVEGVWESGAG